MPDQLQLRGGTTAETNAFTGAAREVTVDTTKKTAVVHDGSTAGGNPLLREDGSNSALALGSQGTPSLKFTGDPNTGIFSPGADQVAVSTGGTERVEWGTSEVVFNDGGANYDFRVEGDTNANLLFVDASTDRIGVGTASPASILHLSGSSDQTYTLQTTTSGADNRINFRNSSGTDAGGIWYMHAGNHLLFNTGGSNQEKVRIDSSGRVGIGTSTAPSGQINLTVNRAGGPGSIQLAYNGASGGAIVPGSAGGLEFFTYTGSIGSETYTERMRIDSSGRVGIGTTSPAAFTPSLQIDGTDPGFFMRDSGTSEFFGMNVQAGAVFSWVEATADFAIGRASGLTGASYTESLRIDSSGRLLVGTSSNSQGTTLLLQGNSSGAGNNATIRMYRGSAPAADGHQLGAIYFGDGSVSGVAGGITAEQDGASWASATSRPTRLRFFTTPSGSASFQERMRIDSNGAVHIFNNIRPWSDNTSQLGTASRRWSTVFAATGTINTSDANLKQDVENLEQAELNIAIAIKGLIKKYRFIDAVQIKGDDARIHVGVIAQEVEQAFIDEGLDPRRYALFCEDTLEDGSKRLGIRYDELLAFVIAAL